MTWKYSSLYLICWRLSDSDDIQHGDQPLHSHQRRQTGRHESHGPRHHHRDEDQHPLPESAQCRPGPSPQISRNSKQPNNSHTGAPRWVVRASQIQKNVSFEKKNIYFSFKKYPYNLTFECVAQRGEETFWEKMGLKKVLNSRVSNP